LQEFSDMAEQAPESTDRKPRADAQRNREHILKVAKQEFTRSGASASLEEIAKKADVGPGTLYRHFPTREDVLVAVYASEMEKLGRSRAESGR
jgi:AcrR family transcriptional regulator